MKKIMSFMITFLLLFFCLGLTIFANPSSVTISDDYQELYLDGNTYRRFNASILDTEYYTYDIPVELNDSQKETIEKVILDTNAELSMVLANIYYKDGAVLTVEFLREDYWDTYENMLTGEAQLYTIDFEHPEDNTITTKKESLWGKSVTLTSEKLEWCDYFPVMIKSADESLTAYVGSLIAINNNYYYVDFDEAHIEGWDGFDIYSYGELPSHEVLDAELVADIETCMENYYSDDFGFLLDNDLSKTISMVFFIVVFAMIPFIIFILFLIFAICSKAAYKKLFRLVYILSATELVIFAVVAAIITIGK